MNLALRWRFPRWLPPWLPLSFGLALALMVSLAALSYRNLRSQVSAADWVAHTYQVITALNRVYSAVLETESAQLAFVASGDENFLPIHQAALQVVTGQIATARALTRDNPDQQTRLRALERLIQERLEIIRQRVDERQRLGEEALGAHVFQGRAPQLMENIRAAISEMNAEEKRLLAERRATQKQVRKHSRNLQWLIGLTSLGLLIFVFVQLTRQLRRVHQAEQLARESNTQLQAANADLKSFAHSVAHDLRAPLRAINGFANVLLEDHGPQLDEEARRALDRIVHNGTRMAQLIDDLLALSRVSVTQIEPRKIEMAPLVREICDELLDLHRDGRKIELSVAPTLPPATGDPSLIRQVWVNLLGNAMKFTRGREPARIEIGGTAAGPEFVTYFVRDNGAGFNMAYLSKLFGAFQRLHRDSEFEGTGIGLALVQRIIQRHGGAVWAEGVEGQGARFAFTLPEWREKEGKNGSASRAADASRD